MNLPNKLTILRTLMVIVIVCLYCLAKSIGFLAPWVFFVILGLFALASFTDFLDGKIARKYNLVTGFGKLMDPLADKLLVISTIAILVDMQTKYFFFWFLIIVVARELFVLGVRLAAIEGDGNVVAAELLGKAKTMTQMISIVVLLVYHSFKSISNMNEVFLNVLLWTGLIIFYISLILLIISGVQVFAKNKKYFKLK